MLQLNNFFKKCMKIKTKTRPNNLKTQVHKKTSCDHSLPVVSLKISEVLQRLHPLSLRDRLYRALSSATDLPSKFQIFFFIFLRSMVKRLPKPILGQDGRSMRVSKVELQLPPVTNNIHP